MKKALLPAMLLMSVLFSLVLPVEPREKLSRPLAAVIGRIRERMPDE